MIETAVFDAKPYDCEYLARAPGAERIAWRFHEFRLTPETAAAARGAQAACIFVNDQADHAALTALADQGVKLIALRCAGYNNVDLAAARALGLAVVRVPAYSPHAVAEHAVGLVLTLNRKIHRAYNRVREMNFSLSGLVGFDLCGKTIGIVGTGRIGASLAAILNGFGCKLLGVDVFHNPRCLEMGMKYVDLPELLRQSDIVSLHCPLTAESHHLINSETIALMKPDSMLINTARGALVDASAVIGALKRREHLGYFGMDVYEEEGPIFFADHSSTIIQDDVFERLTTFPNVVITGHQAFFTREALSQIAEVTLGNVRDFENGKPKPSNLVSLPE